MFRRLFSPFAHPTTAAAHDQRVRFVPPAEVIRWIEVGQACIVDVRETNEFVREHIPGAINMPLSLFDPARLPRREASHLVLHCSSGNRCGLAAARMLASGWEGDILRMQGGLFGWRLAGGPLASGLR